MSFHSSSSHHRGHFRTDLNHRTSYYLSRSCFGSGSGRWSLFKYLRCDAEKTPSSISTTVRPSTVLRERERLSSMRAQSHRATETLKLNGISIRQAHRAWHSTNTLTEDIGYFTRYIYAMLLHICEYL